MYSVILYYIIFGSRIVSNGRALQSVISESDEKKKCVIMKRPGEFMASSEVAFCAKILIYYTAFVVRVQITSRISIESLLKTIK